MSENLDETRQSLSTGKDNQSYILDEDEADDENDEMNANTSTEKKRNTATAGGGGGGGGGGGVLELSSDLTSEIERELNDVSLEFDAPYDKSRPATSNESSLSSRPTSSNESKPPPFSDQNTPSEKDNLDMNNNNQIKYDLVPQNVAEEVNTKTEIKDVKSLEVVDASDKTPKKRRLLDRFKKPARKPPPPGPPAVKIIELFRFADCIDKTLIIVGLFAALVASAIYPLMFLFYGQVAGAFVDLQKYKLNQTLNAPPRNKTQNGTNPIKTNKCFNQLSNPNTDFDGRINQTIGYYVMVGFISLFLMYVANVTLNTSAERQIKRMRNAAYKSIIRQDMAFFDKNTPGELNSVITGNIDAIKDGLGFKLSDFVSMVGRSIACVILSLVAAIKFSSVFLAIFPFAMVGTVLMVMMIKKFTIKEFQAYGVAGRIAQESLSSIRTVLSLGLHKLFIEKYKNNLQEAEKMAKKKGFFTGFFAGVAGFMLNLAFAIAIYYGVYLVRTDCEQYNAGTIMQSFFCMMTGSMGLGQALPYLRDLAEARGAAAKVYAIIDKISQIDVFTSTGKRLNDLKGNIQFNNVFFSYPQRKEAPILKGLNINIPAGKTVALVGSSGGGKSTVISLLERFYLPDSGEITIDGEQLQSLDLNWLRQQIALVQQEPILFTNTIKENIRLGRLDATDEDIIAAAKMANAHNFIMECSQKYDTPCGERGVQLSGGQKQRIAIARALIRNPKILLLDEATSALDYESEKIVQEALDNAKIGRTTIIIAHRLSTIRNADLILSLANGRLVECGSHDELMLKKGLYFELVTAQTNQKHTQKHHTDKKEEDDASDSELTESEDEVETTDLKEEKSKPTNQSSSVKMKEDKKAKRLRKKQEKKKPFYYEKKLFKIQKPETLWIVVGSLAQAVAGAAFPAMALVFSEIYTIFTSPDPNEQERLSLTYMGILLALAVVNFLSTLVLNYAFALSGARLTKRLRIKMFSSMLRQEVGFHDLDENRSSVLSTQLAASTPFCKGLSSDKLGLLSQGVAGVGFSILVALILNWKLALFMCIFVPIVFGTGVFQGKAATNTKVDGKFSFEQGGRLTIETVENIKTVISLNRESYFVGEFERIFDFKFKKTLLVLHLQAFFYSLSNSFLFFIQSASFAFGYYLIKYDNLTVTNLYRIYATMTFSSMILGRVYSQIPDQRKARDATATAFKIISRKSKIDSLSEEGMRPDKVSGQIEFKDVHFHYPNRPQVKILNGLNLKIQNGTTNALVGASGCGKSTTISLLLRFYDIESGSITLDGVDIRQLNINWLRSKIGLVSQEPTLFNTTVKENICYGDMTRTDISMEEIISAAVESNIHARIDSLPQKYDTLVGSKGGQLSGGEKQRVAIARALIRRPVILLLDEATSALDTTSEHVVQDALDKAQLGRTCIVIAHRLSTIENAHKISYFKVGQVVEEGTHQSLMNNKSFYYKLQNKKK